MKHLLLICFALFLAGCAGTRHASTTAKQETEYVNTARLDSLIRAAQLRDSVYVREKGDTVAVYVERIRYQYKTRTDTLYRVIQRCDTVYMERTDSVAVEKPYYVDVVKPIPWYNQGFIWLGRICALLLFIYALYRAIKRKL